MSRRLPRMGFLAFAALVAIRVAASEWERRAVAAASEPQDWSRLDRVLDAMQYVDAAIGVATVVALLAAARTPPAARVRGIAVGAAALEGFGVLAAPAERMLLKVLSAGSGASTEAWIRGISAVLTVAYLAGVTLVVLACIRVARAAGARYVAHVGIAALVLFGARLALRSAGWVLGDHLWSAPGVSGLDMAVWYASSALLVGLTACAGVLLPRVPEAPSDAAGEGAPPAGALPPAWGRIAGGIGLYLGAAGARVLCALLGYLIMSGASGASDYGSLRDVRDGIVMVAVLSGCASVAMLAGVWQIARAPAESNGGGPALAALGFMVMGLGLDVVSTGITADALGGSVSAAFFAMDALPVVAAFSAVLGVGAAVSLLRSFGNIASAVGDEALAARARSTALLAASTGGVAFLVLLGMKHVPVELLLLVAVVLLPMACATLVQFLRVAVPLGQTIRARVATG